MESIGNRGLTKWIDGMMHGTESPNGEFIPIDSFTKYSGTNMSEAFAESYAAYARSGGETNNPRIQPTFDLLRKVLE